MTLNQTINKNYDRLFKVALQACSYDRELAQDLLHETVFMILAYYDLTKLENKYKSENDKVNYLIRCLKNQRYGKTSYFYYKYIKNKPVILEMDYFIEIPDEDYDDEDEKFLNYFIKNKNMFLCQLSFFERYLFTEHIELGKNPNIVGKELSVPRGSIYKAVWAMKVKIKKIIQDEYKKQQRS